MKVKKCRKKKTPTLRVDSAFIEDWANGFLEDSTSLADCLINRCEDKLIKAVVLDLGDADIVNYGADVVGFLSKCRMLKKVTWHSPQKFPLSSSFLLNKRKTAKLRMLILKIDVEDYQWSKKLLYALIESDKYKNCDLILQG